MIMYRKTLAQNAALKGIGLHTGAPCSMVFKPSAQGFISFVRTDIKDSKPIKAELASVSSTNRGTNLKNSTAEVHTVEHVLSAAAALGITDLIVEMDGPEPPIMDGSALEYANAMLKAGFERLEGQYPELKLNKKVEYQEGNITYIAFPSDKAKITFIFTRDGHAMVSRQEYTFEINQNNFLRLIAPARTFGFEEEIAYLHANGLAKGGSADNCVIIQKDKYNVPLRFHDEPVRHKILDMLGDLQLMNMSLGHVHIVCAGGGHKHNIEFAKILIKENNNG